MKKAIINGFFGKGNCGDEAILQTWIHKLWPHFHVVASVDQEVFYIKDYLKSEMYQHIDLIQNRRLDIFAHDNVAGLIIGGGGLGLGFGVEQLLHSKLHNKKNLYLGTIVHDDFINGSQTLLDVNRSVFNLFDLICVRDSQSLHNLKNSFALPAEFFPDVAFALQSDLIDIRCSARFLTVTIRDNGENDIETIKLWLDKIQNFAAEMHCEILYLPFDKTDERLMSELNLKSLYEDIYWKPMQMKYLIENSAAVFSLGRYHPLVFGISAGVPSFFIEHQKSDAAFRYTTSKGKSFNLLQDLNLSKYYLTNNNLNDTWESNMLEPSYSQSAKIRGQMDIFFEKVIQTLKD